ncbi:MAG: response regulator transcription factor, partial [Bacillus sp. (in: firmicutes)]
MDKTKVLIVDDHVLIRKGIKLLLEQFSDIEVIGEASEGAEAIILANKHQPDIVLMDLSMPDGLDGFTAAKAIMADVEHVKVILVTMHDGEIYVRKCITEQLHGYLLKTSQATEMYEAIQTVLAGKHYFQTNLPEEHMERLLKEKQSKPILSLREKGVVRLTSLGYTNVEIAQKLGISPKTVENHKANIMSKLGLKGKHE